MAGGLGTRLFLAGDVITAADVNGYLMNQSIMRFATTAARDTAFGNGIPVGQTVAGIPGDGKPLLQEGMFAYIDFNNDVTYYNGSQWVSAPTFVLADGEVTTAKLANNSVTSEKIAPGTVIAADIAAGTITATELADGAVTSGKILDGTIVNADINASAGIALSKLATSTAGNIIVYNSSGVPTAVTETGDVTISDTGVTAIASGVIVNADINSAAAIALTKLATGTQGTVIVHNASGVPTATAISGDITISNTGVATIAANSVALGTDTTGNYMSDLTQGTGVTITHTPGEGSNATIAIGQSVATSATPTFAGATLDAVQIGVTAANEIDTSSGDLIIDSASGTTSITDNVAVTGTLAVRAASTQDGIQLQGRAGGTGTFEVTMTPATLSADRTLTLPDASGTIALVGGLGGVTLGTDTNGDYVSSLVAGTGITLTNNSGEGATPTVAIGQSVATSASVTFAQVTTTGNVVVGGNLTVNGTTTTLNTDTLVVEDNIIVLNSNVTSSPSTDAGIEVERGTSANVLVRWNETSDKWETTNDGTTYGNIVTTADSGTVTSTMIADGTIVNADINASAAIALSKLATSTAGNIIVYNASGVPTAVAETGDVTISDTGVTAIASGVIVNADISSTAAIEIGKIADVTIDTKTANYTLALTDKNKFIEMNLAGANTVSVPTNSVAFPIGSQIHITQYGAGKTQVVAVTPGTTTIRSTPGAYLRAQYSSATLIKRATEEWYLVGDLSST